MSTSIQMVKKEFDIIFYIGSNIYNYTGCPNKNVLIEQNHNEN